MRLLATYPNIVVGAVDTDGPGVIGSVDTDGPGVVGAVDTSVDTGLVVVDVEQIAKSDVEILGEHFTCSALLQLDDKCS